MMETPESERLLDPILHATDLSEASHAAFTHALAIAVRCRAELTILHVGERPARGSAGFPGVRETLAQWGLLEAGSPRSAVHDQLDMRIRKVRLKGNDPLASILGYMEDKPTRLLVLATRGREGLPRWVQRSVSEALMRRSGAATLFVPAGGRSFASGADGGLDVRRILLPIDHRPAPRVAIRWARAVARLIGGAAVEMTLLHVGNSAPPRTGDLPQDPAWTWNTLRREGEVVAEILRTAEYAGADLIVMGTSGREGMIEALRGSTTERVLHAAPCPVLAVPVSA